MSDEAFEPGAWDFYLRGFVSEICQTLLAVVPRAILLVLIMMWYVYELEPILLYEPVEKRESVSALSDIADGAFCNFRDAGPSKRYDTDKKRVDTNEDGLYLHRSFWRVDRT